MKKKKSHLHFPLILTIIIIFLFLFGIKFFSHTTLSTTQTPPSTNQYNNYPSYKSGTDLYNLGITINLPEGWVGKTNKTSTQINSTNVTLINVYLYPPNYKQPTNPNIGPFWNGIPFSVYPKENSINDFLNKYYPTYKDKLIIEEGTIGNMKSYNLKPNPAKYTGEWANREVVLGNKYAYELGYYSGGDQDSHNKIVSEIYPHITFE